LDSSHRADLAPPVHASSADPSWPLALLVAFRFCVCFFAIATLYLAVGHASALVFFNSDHPVGNAVTDAMFVPTLWATQRLFGSGIVYATVAGFIAYMSTYLIGAGVATIVWSLIDRRRAHYQRAHAGLRIYLRYLLAAVALTYGAVKVIPVQFAPPSLVALITPLGEFTRMRVLWHSMGTSTAYVVFTGLVEVAGALLLFSRRTTTLGALVLAAAFTNVVVLNFGYEVGVQLNATVYVLMALVLLAPDARRLANAFVLNKDVAPADLRLSASGAGRRGLGRLAKALVIVLLLVVHFREAYVEHSRRLRLPALYGIWDVEEFARDGVPVSPGDRARWHRLVVAERGAAAIQWTAGGLVNPYNMSDDPVSGVLTLTAIGGKSPVVTLRYTREADDRLQVSGRVGEDVVQGRLRAMDLTQFPLRRPRR